MNKFAPVAPLFKTDAYKLDHRRQYALAGDVKRVYSNYTNRKSRIPTVDKVVHFGLQATIQQHLMDEFEPFFNHPSTGDVMALYKERCAQILGPDAAQAIGADHIGDLHELGYLPLRFCAVPEGSLVPIKVPSWTVENTQPELETENGLADFDWVTNYFETTLSTGYWLPSTSATIAREYRLILDRAAALTGADPADVAYQAHDFSMRGMSSHESAKASAAGHLLSFSGSDTCSVLDWIDEYYGESPSNLSIPATEHSVMSAGTASIGEYKTYEGLLDLYPTGSVAIVSDTYDLWNVLMKFLPELREKILNRDGKLIIRPDSGDPYKILMGDFDAKYGSPAYYGVVRLLAGEFGFEFNDKGFKVLNGHIGAVYGDSITLERAERITDALRMHGFASTNVTFGVGSFSYQFQTRDSFGSALKATEALIDGESVPLYKSPVTDSGMKRSARGRLAVDWADDRCLDMVLIENATPEQEAESLLQPVWENGKFIRRQSFEDVRTVLGGG